MPLLREETAPGTPQWPRSLARSFGTPPPSTLPDAGRTRLISPIGLGSANTRSTSSAWTKGTLTASRSFSFSSTSVPNRARAARTSGESNALGSSVAKARTLYSPGARSVTVNTPLLSEYPNRATDFARPPPVSRTRKYAPAPFPGVPSRESSVGRILPVNCAEPRRSMISSAPPPLTVNARPVTSLRPYRTLPT